MGNTQSAPSETDDGEIVADLETLTGQIQVELETHFDPDLVKLVSSGHLYSFVYMVRASIPLVLRYLESVGDFLSFHVCICMPAVTIEIKRAVILIFGLQ